MRVLTFILTSLAACVGGATTTSIQRFAYGSTNDDGSNKLQADFESEFSIAKALVGTNGAFSGARLYTTIVCFPFSPLTQELSKPLTKILSRQQGGSISDPTQAIPAAIAAGTTLLLGLWASSGPTLFNNEIAALKSAISTYGTSFTDLVVGVAVGSEGLYRNSVAGIAADSGLGVGPDVLQSFITQVRTAVKGTRLEFVPIGRVDTYTAWTNSSNSAVVSAVDWLGVDIYPYSTGIASNSIDNDSTIFQDAYTSISSLSSGKPIWVTETGWPTTGPLAGQAVPSISNTKKYWDDVGCGLLFGTTNTWWYTLISTPVSPDFGVVDNSSTPTPLFDLSCTGVTPTESTSPQVSDAIISSTAFPPHRCPNSGTYKLIRPQFHFIPSV
jgi:glucan endo-1,3-beta-D-glucosidase